MLTEAEVRQMLEEYYNKISALVEALFDISKFCPDWLYDLTLNGNAQASEINLAVPEELGATMEDKYLLLMMRHINSPGVVFQAFFNIILGERCGDEARRRLSPVTNNVAGMVFLQDEYQREDFNAIMNRLRACTKRLWLPQEVGTSEHQNEKDCLLGWELAKQIDPLRKIPARDFWIQAMEGKLDCLPRRIKNRFESKIRWQNAQQRMPKGGIQSLEEEVELPDGSSVPVELLLGEEDPQLENVDEDFTQEQLDALDEELGPIGREIFVYRYRHQEIIGRGEGRIIAKKLRYATSTVSKYLEIIEAKAPVIKKIMMG